MLKVVDAGGLRSSMLSEFLQRDARNFAVVTDFASMESLKGDAMANARASFAILHRFPKQVVVLKNTARITLLAPKASGLHARFRDDRQTREFGAFCREIYAPHGPSKAVHQDVARKQILVEATFQRLIKTAEGMRSGIRLLATSFHPDDLHALRAKKTFSTSFRKRLVGDVLMITAMQLKEYGLQQLPAHASIVYSFTFRFSLCCYCLILKWIEDSGYESISAKRLQNDFTDMTYAAYGTFYDGLITQDKKLAEVNRSATWLLDNVFLQ